MRGKSAVAVSGSSALYRPPATTTMIARQDEPRALRLLLAQRLIYNRAKRWSFLRWIGFSVIGLAAPVLTIIAPQLAVLVAGVAGIWIFLSRTWFAAREQTEAAKAAQVQELFDQFIFGMPEQVTRVPSASLEEISSIVGDDQSVQKGVERQKLRGWYPFDRRLPGLEAIAIAQRSNAGYAERLLTVNANIWLGTAVLWAAAALTVGIVVRLTLPTFLLGVAFPLLPALLVVWDHHQANRRAGQLRRAMADDIEKSVRGQTERNLAPEDLLLWQSRLYELRRSSPQIPNLVYRRRREQNERAMTAAAAELAAAALGRLSR